MSAKNYQWKNNEKNLLGKKNQKIIYSITGNYFRCDVGCAANTTPLTAKAVDALQQDYIKTPEFEIIITPDFYPIIFKKTHYFGIVPDSSISNGAVVCNTSTCSSSAISAGAYSFRYYNISGYGLVAFYFDSSGEVIGFSQDLDGDGIGNLQDADIDGDGVLNQFDANSYNSTVWFEPGNMVGNTTANLEVTYGGAAAYTVPIAVPTGAAGLKPNVALKYNSQYGNGNMGLGWQLSTGMAMITECYKPRSNIKTICLNGEELISIGDNYYRTKIDSGILVRKDNAPMNTFHLLYENGTIKRLDLKLTKPNVYLETANVQRGGASYAVTWSVSNTNREPLVTKISYYGNTVEFAYESRSDVRHGYWMGAVKNRTKRLARVTSKRDGSTYRQYNVYYKTDNVTGMSLVSSVQECAAYGGCLEPLTFDWTSSGSRGLAEASEGYDKVRSIINKNNDGITDIVTSDIPSNESNVFYGDLNGDGLDDKIYRIRAGHVGSILQYKRVYRLRKKDYTLGSVVSLDQYGNRIGILKVLDLNADGYDDIVFSDRSIWQGGSNGISNTSHKLPGFSVTNYPVQLCWTTHYGDVNGDNLIDVIVVPVTSNTCTFNRNASYVYLNIGGFKYADHLTTSLPHTTESTSIHSFTDINGDGLADAIYYRGHNKSIGRKERLSFYSALGNGSFSGYKTIKSNQFYGSDSFQDFNGDGLLDLLRCNRISLRHDYEGCDISYNNGQSFGSWTQAWTGSHLLKYTADFDGDGSQDFIIEDVDYGPHITSITRFGETIYFDVSKKFNRRDGNSKRPHITSFNDSNGNQYKANYGKLTDASVYQRDDGQSISSTKAYQQGVSVVKSIETPTKDVYYKYAGARIHNGDYGYLGFSKLATVIAKKNENNKDKALLTVTHLHQTYPYIGKVNKVSKRVVNNTASDTIESLEFIGDAVTYNVAGGGRFTLKSGVDISSNEKSFSGSNFEGQLDTVYTWSSIVINDSAIPWYLRITGLLDHVFVKKPYLLKKTTQYYDLSNNLTKIETTSNTWSELFDNYARLNKTEHTVANEDNQLLQKIVKTYSYIKDEDYGKSTSYLVDILSTEVATYSRDGLLADVYNTEIDYDYNRNNLIELEKHNNTSNLGTSTEYSYDTYGNIETTTVSSASGLTSDSQSTRTTTRVYTNSGKDLASETNSLGHQTQYSLYNVHGLPQRVIDANGLVTDNYYDGLGRIETTLDHLANYSYASRDFCSNAPTGCSNGAHYWEKVQAIAEPITYTFFDKLGRVVKTAKQSFSANEWTVSVTEYDEYGRVSEQSTPIKTTLSNSISLNTQNATQNTYDVLDRVVTQNLPGNREQSTNYDNDLAVKYTDPLNRVWITKTNALGQVIEKGLESAFLNSIEPSTRVSFKYNAQGLPVEQHYAALDSAGNFDGSRTNVIRKAYDINGNLLSENDPNKGLWQYEYNAYGELIQQTDARNQAIHYAYDELGRLVEQRDEQSYSLWEYDAINENGLLQNVVQFDIANLTAAEKAALTPSSSLLTDINYDEYFVHNSNKQLVTQTKHINNANDTLETGISNFTYDQYGRLQYQTLPTIYKQQGTLTQPELEYEYNAQGYLAATRERYIGTYYQEIKNVDAFGNITEQVLGDNVQMNNTFDANTGWANSLTAKTILEDAAFVQQTYSGYNNIGLMGSRSDAVYYSNGQSESWTDTFTYDNSLQQQIAKVEIDFTFNNGVSPVTSAWSHDYTYDLLGNLRTKSITNNGASTPTESVSYQYNDANAPHRLTATSGDLTRDYSNGYDNNGNVTNDGLRSFSYNSFNKVATVTQGSDTTRFEYGPDRSRYLRVDSNGSTSTETLYLNNYERVSGNSSGNSQVEHKFYIGSIAIITQTENPTVHDEVIRYRINDYQDSVVAITDENGALQQRFRYTPYGEQIDVSAGIIPAQNITTRGYTAHEHIATSNIIHMNGRIYDSTIGRMLQADIVVQAPTFVLSYNRYAYVWNNPINAVDPTGYFTVESSAGTYAGAYGGSKEAWSNGNTDSNTKGPDKNIGNTGSNLLNPNGIKDGESPEGTKESAGIDLNEVDGAMPHLGAGKDAIELTIGQFRELQKNGSVMLDDGRIVSLAYYGNQHDPAKMIANAKAVQKVLADIGDTADRIGKGLTIITITTDIYKYSIGDMSDARFAYKGTGHISTIVTGFAFGGVPGAAVGLGFYGLEVTYDVSKGFIERETREINEKYQTDNSFFDGFLYGDQTNWDY